MTAARPLLFVGAGGLARETLAAVRAASAAEPAGPVWRPLGLLDDDPARQGSEVDGLTVLGPLEAVHDHPDAAVVICTGSARDPASRRRIAHRLDLPDDRYGTVVHPAASVATGTVLGPGCTLLAGCVVTAPQRVGRHVVAMPQVLLTHDDEVGDFVTMAGRVALAGGVRVGEGAYLGAGALVREGLTIGAWSVLGMGSIVLADVPPGEVWVGVPARRLRQIGSPLEATR
jgi:sugar O-acyltransferase (sialic acid O-acetyltransferase NeuD family)